ncbi:DUF4007 family protein [Caulobacter sp. RHG1]|uniref:DUF4007 family protein n=1 Tax=Caulobacter sp. (strain RHG1) TaxID=2545762 RepID=UPI0015567473|nr:DUF4007 family protein [Caulobacter sp. RHG1]NQE65007.1 hypothetical protein [Caulobacter sp. RHG1]
MRDAFTESDTRGAFAGHETFPLRLLWLKKAYNVAEDGLPSRTFQEPDAIGRFGVGKNMAMSIRFWALSAGVLEEYQGRLKPTEFGQLILSDKGLDPYLEEPATIWALHAHLAGQPLPSTTTYFAFSGLNLQEFDAATLVSELEAVVAKRGWRATSGTLKRDVEVLLRGYVSRTDANEDAVEPLMAELGLIRETRSGGYFEFVRGPKPSLPDGVFAYALARFWERRHHASPTLSVEQASYGPGSPGRIFKLGEDDVAARMSRVEAYTNEAWRFTDTAGLRQIQKIKDIDLMSLLRSAYHPKGTA